MESSKILFLHHSVGSGILAEGNLRSLLKQLAPEWQLWDHGYNEQGLSDQHGVSTGRNFNIPRDDTNPPGYAMVFAQPLTSPPQNAFSQIMEYDVIIFKSCFPVSQISSDAQLEEYKNYYRQIRQIINQYPQKFFVAFTQPPLNSLSTNAGEAERARTLTGWLKEGEFSAGAHNLAIFDLYALLADNTPGSKNYGTLRLDFRRQGLRFWRPTGDSHPNAKANQVVAKHFAEFLVKTVKPFHSLNYAN